jgi:hypothetical protein
MAAGLVKEGIHSPTIRSIASVSLRNSMTPMNHGERCHRRQTPHACSAPRHSVGFFVRSIHTLSSPRAMTSWLVINTDSIRVLHFLIGRAGSSVTQRLKSAAVAVPRSSGLNGWACHIGKHTLSLRCISPPRPFRLPLHESDSRNKSINHTRIMSLSRFPA